MILIIVFIECKHDKNIEHIGYRTNNVYMINLNKTSNHTQCFLSTDDESWLWHRRITHINMKHLNKLISKYLVIGLPKLKFEKYRL